MEQLKAMIPVSPDRLGGPSVEMTRGFRVLAQRDKAVIMEFHDLPEGVKWVNKMDRFYGQLQHDEQTFKVIRLATDEEQKLFRIPSWIQDEEVPECCGQEMFFVGQIDDNDICDEQPEGAEVWWHDVASFYVFTCPKCLNCKAVGQQF